LRRLTDAKLNMVLVSERAGNDRIVILASRAVHLDLLSCMRAKVGKTQIQEAMKLRNIVCSVVGSLLVAGLFIGCASEKSEREEQAKLEAQAKISRADAEKAALAKVAGGTIKEGEIEKEKGKLIWSFDVATAGTKDITEVHVDAMTGEVVGMEKETAKDEAKEKR
jgi:hypothetical protein